MKASTKMTLKVRRWRTMKLATRLEWATPWLAGLMRRAFRSRAAGSTVSVTIRPKMTPLASVRPRSAPKRSCISDRARKPATVVSAEGRMASVVAWMVACMAVTGSGCSSSSSR